jgi:hypothetical protein
MMMVRRGGTYEMKYPVKKSQGSRVDFIQPERNEIISRGTASITRRIELIMR